MIKLPEYRVIVPDCVYSKSITSYGHYMPCDHSTLKNMSEIVILTRFRVPSLDSLVEMITSTSQNMFSLGEKSNPPNIGENAIARVLSKTGSKTVKSLALKDKEAIAHLKSHYPLAGYCPERDYLQLLIGIMPDPLIEKLAELKIPAIKNLVKTFVINLKNMPIEWSLKLRLEAGMKIPEVESLLEKGVSESYVIDTLEPYGSFENVATHARLLYQALDTPEKIGLVFDNTSCVIPSLAISTTTAFVKCKNMEYMHRQMDRAIARAKELSRAEEIVEEIPKEEPGPTEKQLWTKEQIFKDLHIT